MRKFYHLYNFALAGEKSQKVYHRVGRLWEVAREEVRGGRGRSRAENPLPSTSSAGSISTNAAGSADETICLSVNSSVRRTAHNSTCCGAPVNPPLALSMINSLFGACVLRLVWIYTVFAACHEEWVLFLNYPVTWTVTAAIPLVCVWWVTRQLIRKDEPAEAKESAPV